VVRVRVRVGVRVRVRVTAVLVEHAAAEVRDRLLPVAAHAPARRGEHVVVRQALACWRVRVRVRVRG